jgi:hypothetical protein
MCPATLDGDMPAEPDDQDRRCVPLPGGGVRAVRPATPRDVDGLEALYAALEPGARQT